MPLGVREVLLVVRAQNMASGTLRSIAGDFNALDREAKTAAQVAMQQGQALMALGAAIGAVGVAGLAFLGKATSEAVEYNKQVALTKTQMYGVKASFDQVAQAGLDAASKIAVPLDQIQGGLYDIFSSMDVNLKQAQFLLTNFSKEAVAGQVDLSTAEKASIGILNSYGMKVKDVTKVQDIMFNLVKYGVGTYGDFASVIGRVTPSAVRANQSFAETAALMAFTTRNGLSAANASSSVARALDAIGKSRNAIEHVGMTVQGALGDETAKKLGFTKDTILKLTDASGRLLPINQIMTEMGTSLKNLNPTQLNDVLTEMFKGTGGTIQAMRFVDLAVKNYGQLNKMVKEMGNSKGALQAAYNTMANTPAAQIQLLKNNFHILMIEIGDVLLPVLNKFVIGLKDMFGWLGKIPKPVIMIGTVVLGIVSILMVLAGAVMIAVGAWTVLSTILEASEIELLPIIGTAALVVAAIIALAAAAYFIYKYWDPISKWFHNMWFDMWHWVDKIWHDIWHSIDSWWGKITQVFKGIEDFFSSNFDKWWLTHGEAVEKIWNAVWTLIGGDFKSAATIITGLAKVWFALFLAICTAFWLNLELIFRVGWTLVSTVFKIFFNIINALWKVWFQGLILAAKIWWAAIQLVLKTAWDVLVLIFDLFLDIMTGHWHQAWVDIKSFGIQVWNNIKQFLVTVWNAIKVAGISIGHIFVVLWDQVWNNVKNGAVDVWHDIYQYLQNIWGDIKSGAQHTVDGLKDIWSGLKDAFATPINWVIQYVYDDGIKALWNTVMNAIGLSKWDLPNVTPLKFASGGRLNGWGGGDVVPALLEPGETVVDKVRSKRYAHLFKMMGVPGYATGGRILAFGASTTAGVGSTGGHNYVSDLQALMGSKYSILNAGISGNQLVNTSANGTAGQLRFGGHLNKIIAALLWEGNNDIAAGVSSAAIESAYTRVAAQAHNAGVKIAGMTLQPSNFSGAREKTRRSVNDWIKTSKVFDTVADVSRALQDPNDHSKMASWVYNAGQAHANHPGNAGYAEVAKLAEFALHKMLGTTKGSKATSVASSGRLESLETLRRHFNKGNLNLFEKHLWHLLHIGTPWSKVQQMYPNGQPRGFAKGGIVGGVIDIAKMTAAAATGNEVAFINALTNMAGGNSGAGGKLASMVATLPVAMMSKVAGSIWKSINGKAKVTEKELLSGGTAGPGGGSVAQNQQLAKQLMPAWSFGPFWSDWLMLWNRESGWNQFAENPASHAYGIPQALPWTKMPKAAWPARAGGSSNVHAQETWGIGYIGGRYGNPANAWDHELSFGWYDNGGPLRPGWTLAYNGTGKDEQVVQPGKAGPTQNFYIYTQEINPKKHAAELGFELARRSG